MFLVVLHKLLLTKHQKQLLFLYLKNYLRLQNGKYKMETYKQHPNYWLLHKKIWTEEFNSLDNEISRKVVDDPDCDESIQLDQRVCKRIEQALLTPA